MGSVTEQELVDAYQTLFPDAAIVLIRGEPIAITDKELERLG